MHRPCRERDQVRPLTCRSQVGQVRRGGRARGPLFSLNLLKVQRATLLGPTRVPPSTLRTPSRPGPAASKGAYLPESSRASTRGVSPPGPGRAPYSAPTRPYSVPALRQVRGPTCRSQVGQVPGGGPPPGPEAPPLLPLLGPPPSGDNPPTRPSRPPYSGV